MKLSLTDSSEKTYIKLVVDKATDKILSCYMIGEDAGEMIQLLAIASKAGATKHTFDKTIGIHPSAQEWIVMRTPHQ